VESNWRRRSLKLRSRPFEFKSFIEFISFFIVKF
jgi:hypothetical protein